MGNHQLPYWERYLIEQHKSSGERARSIAKMLHRSPSTSSRELSRRVPAAAGGVDDALKTDLQAAGAPGGRGEQGIGAGDQALLRASQSWRAVAATSWPGTRRPVHWHGHAPACART